MMWGRKFVAGLSIEAVWTIMLLTDTLGEDAYVKLSIGLVASLFGASVVGKFAK